MKFNIVYIIVITLWNFNLSNNAFFSGTSHFWTIHFVLVYYISIRQYGDTQLPMILQSWNIWMYLYRYLHVVPCVYLPPFCSQSHHYTSCGENQVHGQVYQHSVPVWDWAGIGTTTLAWLWECELEWYYSLFSSQNLNLPLYIGEGLCQAVGGFCCEDGWEVRWKTWQCCQLWLWNWSNLFPTLKELW